MMKAEQLEDAGLSQRGAARELGIDERTMRKYCSGDLPVPRTIILALRYLALIHGNEEIIDRIDKGIIKLGYSGTNITAAERERLAAINKMLRSIAKQTRKDE